MATTITPKLSEFGSISKVIGDTDGTTTIAINTTFQLTAPTSSSPANPEAFLYESSNLDVATVNSSSGVVTIKKLGNAFITASQLAKSVTTPADTSVIPNIPARVVNYAATSIKAELTIVDPNNYSFVSAGSGNDKRAAIFDQNDEKDKVINVSLPYSNANGAKGVKTTTKSIKVFIYSFLGDKLISTKQKRILNATIKKDYDDSDVSAVPTTFDFVIECGDQDGEFDDKADRVNVVVREHIFNNKVKLTLMDQSVDITTLPSAPIVELNSVKFSPTSPTSKDLQLIGGTLTITIPDEQDLKKITSVGFYVYVSKINSTTGNAIPSSVREIELGYDTTNKPRSIIVELTEYNTGLFKGIRPESTLSFQGYIVDSLNEKGDLSKSADVVASTRPAPVTIISATSLQDKKVTIKLSLTPVITQNATSGEYYSILGQECKNVSDLKDLKDNKWRKTNVDKKAYPIQEGNKTSVALTEEVNKITFPTPAVNITGISGTFKAGEMNKFVLASANISIVPGLTVAGAGIQPETTVTAKDADGLTLTLSKDNNSAAGQTVSTYSFTKAAGAPLGDIPTGNGNGFAFIVVRHKDDIDVAKSVNPSDDDPALRPVLTQSNPSNKVSAVAISVIDKTVEFVLSSQVLDNDNKKITFNPKFIKKTDGYSFPLDSAFTYSFEKNGTSVKDPVVVYATSTGFDQNVLDQDVLVDSNNTPTDKYNIKVTIEQTFGSDTYSLIDKKTAAGSIYSSNAATYVTLLKEFNLNTQRKKDVRDCPVVKNLKIDLNNLSQISDSKATLYSSWQIDSQIGLQNLELKDVETQVIAGSYSDATANADSLPWFYHPAAAEGLIKKNKKYAGKSGEESGLIDVDDTVTYDKLFSPVGQGASSEPFVLVQGSYTVRARAVYIDNNSTLEVFSPWSYSNKSFNYLGKLNPPTSVDITMVAAKTPSFRVDVGVPLQTDINKANAPEEWKKSTTFDVLAYEAVVTLFNEDGEIVASDKKPVNATTSPIDILSSNKVSFSFNNTTAKGGQTVYAECYINYQKKGDSSFEKGSVNDRNSSYVIVKPAMSITAVTLSQFPILKDAEGKVLDGPRRVEDSGMEYLQVSADVDFGGLSKESSTVVCFFPATEPSADENTPFIEMNYNQSSKLWETSSYLLPIEDIHYQTTKVLVIAYNEYSSNAYDFFVLK